MKCTKEKKDEMCQYIAEGYSQKQAAKRAGVGESTLFEWKYEDADFAKQILQAREEYQDTVRAKLEVSLFKKATGYEVKEKETEYGTDKNGNQIVKRQKIKIKEVPADTTAIMFALTNVAPDVWKQRTTVNNTLSAKIEPETAADEIFAALPDDLLAVIADRLQGISDGSEAQQEQ